MVSPSARFIESYLFGLHNGTVATAEEARNTYSMLTKNRETILAYEAKFGVAPGSTATTGNYLTVAQVNYDQLRASMDAQLAGSGGQLPTDPVPTLIQSLGPAYVAFIQYANPNPPKLVAGVHFSNLFSMFS